MDVCYIDLATCPTIQSAYVMLSRVQTLKGLGILCSFSLDRIQNCISKELRAERCTEIKAKKTKTYSWEHLSWFYNLIPERVKLLIQGDLPVQGLDVIMTPVSSKN
jgi:hypothetical protein